MLNDVEHKYNFKLSELIILAIMTVFLKYLFWWRFDWLSSFGK